MKKVIALVICVLMVVAVFAACQAEEAAPAAEEAAEEAAPAAEEAAEEPAAEEPAAEEEAPAEEPAAEPIKLDIGLYADAAGSYYDLLYEAMDGCAKLDPECDWTIDYQLGQGTATEQITAVENFITAGYDVICVIQNSVEATSECIAKCEDAGIPYFGLTHDFSSADNCTDAEGSIAFDFVQAGKYAGLDAAERGIHKIINIQGVLGQGSAGGQSRGLLLGLEEGGANLGADVEDILINERNAKYDGTQDTEIVFWGAGEWIADTAQKCMTDAITSLGPDGFDGVYVHNDPMCEGVIAAMENAGLDPKDYWIGCCNGREISWQWAKDGIMNLDCNQPAAFEGALAYQQVKAWAKGEDYRKWIHPYLTPYTEKTIAELEPTMIPCTDIDKFLEMYEAGTIDVDINSPEVKDMEAYAGK